MSKIRNGVDYTSRDYEGFRTDLINMLKTKIPEYSDFSSSDFGIVLIELLAHGLDVMSYYNDKVANEIFPETATERESIIKHCRRVGYQLRTSTPSQFYQVFKILPQEQDYIVPKGFKLRTKGEDSIEFELIEDLTIPQGCTGLEKDSQGEYLYTALIEQGFSVVSDIIGSSNSEPYQEFLLSYSPVIEDSLHVTVKSDSTTEVWNRVENFIDSDFNSKDYMVETNEAEETKILFGGGSSGMIPPIYDNGILADYRVGGGEVGNVALGVITEMFSKPSIILETVNVAQVKFARDKETIEEARINAPQSLKTLWRAVSLMDYENLLIQEFDGEVVQAKAIAEADRFTVSVYIQDKMGEMSTERKNLYLEFLDDRKEIGYQIKIYNPVYVNMNLTVNITTNKSHLNDNVKSTVKAYLNSKYKENGFKFNEEFLKSPLIGELMRLQGVWDLDIVTSGTTKPTNPNQIVKVANIVVNVVGGV